MALVTEGVQPAAHARITQGATHAADGAPCSAALPLTDAAALCACTRAAEGKLEAAFRAEASRLVAAGGAVGQALRYVAWDMHKECGSMRYHRLSLLWDQVRRAARVQP